MKLDCSACGRVLEFSGDCPLFCACCGRPLSDPRLVATGDFHPAQDATTDTLAGKATEERGAHPDQVGRFRLGRLLGQGGMGSVYEGEDTTSGRRVAIKLIASQDEVDAGIVERFRQEGRLASDIAHPRCVFVFAADEDAGQPYIVMELMPGATLKDLVDKHGPLAPEDAVAKILDVVEGLQEAHRKGVIHRDVKPSNCFLTDDGRVKIGDFGLAKSLAADVHLTRSGAFMGTPLYASPEQIRNDPLNEQTDVYSVVATLFFLLTGRAPFEGGDATATIARIVSEPAPSVRAARPDLSAFVDKVVLKGLERNRERRHRNLEELRQALAPLTVKQFDIAGLGLRLGALVVDWLIASIPAFALGVYLRSVWPETEQDRVARVSSSLTELIVWLSYFFVTEWRWGCSIGKWLAGLRVRLSEGFQPPGVRRVLLRTLVFGLLMGLGDRCADLRAAVFSADPFPGEQWLWLTGLNGVGLLLVLAPMRKRNGFRGLHEWVSETRVVLLPRSSTRRQVGDHFCGVPEVQLLQPPGLPERVGPFAIRGAYLWTAEEKVLLGEDAGLGRQVWIWSRPLASDALTPARQTVDRTTRLRWLCGGREADGQWDAFMAPAGCPLDALIKKDGKLSWAAVRPVLGELAGELAVAAQDGTIPQSLSVRQAWLRQAGAVQLLDMNLGERVVSSLRDVSADSRELTFLYELAVWALEGSPRPPEDTDAHIRIPLPGYATEMLERLRGDRGTFRSVDEFRSTIDKNQYRAVELTRSMRLAQLIASLILHTLALAMFAPFVMPLAQLDGPITPFLLLCFPLCFVALCAAWGFLTRDGISYLLNNVLLVNAEGRRASRVRLAWRTLLFWAPPVLIFAGAIYLLASPWQELVVLLALPSYFLIHLVLALWSPARSPLDRLCGIYLVPR